MYHECVRYRKLHVRQTYRVSDFEVLPALGAEGVETLVEGESIPLPLEDGRLLFLHVGAIEARCGHE